MSPKEHKSMRQDVIKDLNWELHLNDSKFTTSHLVECIEYYYPYSFLLRYNLLEHNITNMHEEEYRDFIINKMDLQNLEIHKILELHRQLK